MRLGRWAATAADWTRCDPRTLTNSQQQAEGGGTSAQVRGTTRRSHNFECLGESLGDSVDARCPFHSFPALGRRGWTRVPPNPALSGQDVHFVVGDVRRACSETAIRRKPTLSTKILQDVEPAYRTLAVFDWYSISWGFLDFV